jgi:D-sedoheptulose 7-phosphate isomerase
MSSPLNLAGLFTDAITDHLNTIIELRTQEDMFECAAMHITDCVHAGFKVLWCGNGGSAADAQHMAAELVSRFRRERRGLASLALTTDTSVLTAIANDTGYDEVFARQVEALCDPGDVLIGISTSGNSRNVCLALTKAREIGAFTIAMTGEHGGQMARIADLCLRVGSNDTARVQEGQLLFGHMLCEWVELATCLRPALGSEASIQ